MKSYYVYREQFPLIPAAAITIHKSQGLSLDNCIVDLSEMVFGSGMAYVALSRVRSLSGLHLVNFSKKSIIVSRKCLEELNRLRKQFRPDLPMYRVPPEKQPTYITKSSKRSVEMPVDIDEPPAKKRAAGCKKTNKPKCLLTKKKPPPTGKKSTPPVTKKPSRGRAKKRGCSTADTAEQKSKSPCIIDSSSTNCVKPPEASHVLSTGIAEDVFITHKEGESTSQYFYPVNESWQKRACTSLGVRFRFWNRMPSGFADVQVPLTEPDPRRVRRIDGDGNCLFRCFSFIVTGCEKQHVQIRNAILHHMVSIAHLLLGRLMNYSSVQEYIEQTRMYLSGTWGTEIEIFTFSHLLQIPIFTYDVTHGKWWKHCPSVLERRPAVQQNEMGMYILHPRNHYEVVYGVMPS